jgi:CheY-like chemotaxis protein
MGTPSSPSSPSLRSARPLAMLHTPGEKALQGGPMDEGGQEGPRVLLVDDDAANLAALREVLESEGIEVVGDALDGASGVQLAERLHPDVVLMDLRMRGMDGFEATAAIREARPSTQVVILTAYEELLTKSADDVGAFAYLVKGCSSELMRQVIDQAWRRGGEVRRRAGEA